MYDMYDKGEIMIVEITLKYLIEGELTYTKYYEPVDKIIISEDIAYITKRLENGNVIDEEYLLSEECKDEGTHTMYQCEIIYPFERSVVKNGMQL
jgi:hypothetical protein